MDATICEKTIAYGKQRWRVSSSGKWSVMMWGWWSDGGGHPSYRWVGIESAKVPKEVKEAV